METATMLISLMIGTFIAGVMCGGKWSEGDWVPNYKDKPYCVTKHIVDAEYKRCWKAVEVQP